jgi:hypothetical protein
MLHRSALNRPIVCCGRRDHEGHRPQPLPWSLQVETKFQDLGSWRTAHELKDAPCGAIRCGEQTQRLRRACIPL